MEVPVAHSVMVGLPLCVPEADGQRETVPLGETDLDNDGDAEGDSVPEGDSDDV